MLTKSEVRTYRTMVALFTVASICVIISAVGMVLEDKFPAKNCALSEVQGVSCVACRWGASVAVDCDWENRHATNG